MKKIVIIDYNGMPYRYIYGGAPQLWHTVNGVAINTTIPAYTIKEIVRLSGYGDNELAVVMDMGKPIERSEKLVEAFGQVYKEGRKSQMPSFYAGINLTEEILRLGGVSVYREKGIEADDIIYNLAREKESQGYKVEIFTNDSDLLCLVNADITVYFRGKKTLGEFKNYIRIDRDNFEEYVNEFSATKGYYIPYNSIYFFKLLRGDKADNLPAFKGYGQAKYNDFMWTLASCATDFKKFRPENFDYILKCLEQFEYDGTDSGLVEHVKKMHYVMEFEALELSNPTRYDWTKLQIECSRYRITLPQWK